MKRILVLSFSLAFSLMACRSTGLGADGGAGNGKDGGAFGYGDLASSDTSCIAIKRTCADIEATFIANAAGLTVDCDDSTGLFTINSTGIPPYTSDQSTPNAIGDQTWVIQLPLNPVCSATTTNVVDSRGPVGFMINGIPFYGPEDANGNDAVVNEGKSFDNCQGHADQSCAYHYHEESSCVFGQGDSIANHTLPDGHAPVIGYAFDGFALYAEQDGAVLDKCNGHYDEARGYHYHATTSIPYLLGCYHGVNSGIMMRQPSCSSTGADAGTAGKDGGERPPRDGGMPVDGMPMIDGGACGQNGTCAQNFVCCPVGLGCANMCVPDCRNGGCMNGLTCDQSDGVCKP